MLPVSPVLDCAAPDAPVHDCASFPGAGRPIVLAAAPAPQGLQPKVDLPFGLGSFRPRLILQYDAGGYLQSASGPPETDFRRGGLGAPSSDDSPAGALRDGARVRRARFGMDGTFLRDITYRATFELGANEKARESRITEVWLSYNRFSPFTIKVGAFPQPANLDDASAADGALFFERATASQLSRSLGAGDGRLGVTLKYADRGWGVAVSLTGAIINNAPSFESRKTALVVRLARMIRMSTDDEVQIGGSGAYVVAADQNTLAGSEPGSPVRLREYPELRVDETRLIDTGDLIARRARVAGLDLAARHRNLYAQAEVFGFDVQRPQPTALSDPQFAGFYIQGSWIITGEHRAHDATALAFRPPDPARPVGKGGSGAWEVALRYSRMNLNYRPGQAGQSPPPDGVRGGDQQILTIGLNWYLTASVALMFDYMNVRVDRLNPAEPANPEPFGPAPGTPPIGVQIGQKLNIFAVRAQYAF